MNTFSGAVTAIAITAAGPLVAMDLNGARIGIGYEQLGNDVVVNETRQDAAKLSVEGSAEIGFSRQIAVQADAALDYFTLSDDTGDSIGLHGILHAGRAASLGVFAVHDALDDYDFTFYGAEVGADIGGFDLETYAMAGSEGDTDAEGYGLTVEYEAVKFVSLGARYDRINTSSGGTLDADIDRYAATVGWDVTPGTTISGEIGRASGDIDGSDGSDTYVGVTASFAFGADRGTTFNRRGLLDLLPGG